MLRSCANIRGPNLLAYTDIWQMKWKMSPVLNQNMLNGFFEGWKPNEHKYLKLKLNKFDSPICYTNLLDSNEPMIIYPICPELAFRCYGHIHSNGREANGTQPICDSWSENLILGMEPKFHADWSKIDDIGARACIAYTTVYCFSRNLDI